MSDEITVQQLAEESGKSVPHIQGLIKKGYLPAGRKDGRNRYLPAFESRLILATHVPGTHWVANRPRPGKRKTVQEERGQSFETLETSKSPVDIDFDQFR